MAARIVIAGGGTGGHLMPGLAVARALRAAGAEPAAFVGTARGLEAKLVPAAGFRLETIRIGGLKTGGAGRRLATLAQLPRAVAHSVGLLRRLRAQAVLGIGGYASGPVLAAAALLRVPVVVLEVNAKTGLANRWAAPWVATAAVNFPETARDFRRAVVTGIPVRPEFFRAAAAAAAASGPPLVLVTGGSQGAHALNQVVREMAPQVAFRLLHQTGAADLGACQAAYAGLGGRARAVAFVDDMAAAMAEAALVVGRAGASTLGELAAARRPAILVPFPGAADQHQLRNAQAYARAGAAEVMEQARLSPAGLGARIEQLLAAPARLEAMRQAVGGFAHPRAAEEIAALVLAAAAASRMVD
ncbi:MAG TPA: undecaprenyldiphospho-muramoylpentapeptide beta-N-acetylglucosaminyltransferase [Terriglobales bacterium]|nr:undecaprenyldiphospho-muramoylpentapeptide beta-N-acetylglucosaminyltransferase [Terriglobales bacterium]